MNRLKSKCLCRVPLFLLVVLFALDGAAAKDHAGSNLPGFVISPHWGEQIKTYVFEPDAKVHINAPSPEAFAPKKPVRVILFALPNGNTTAQTIGRKMEEGLDWHYDIQHIGAQTRRLREVVTDANLVVAYLEAESRSWPSWRRNHAESGKLIHGLITSVTESFASFNSTLELSAHSGGGSLIFGYLDSVERIPPPVKRIVLLDSNYNYNDEAKHGDKLLEWLRRSPEHHLIVIAYDDRNITLNGKRVVGPTGGTYRATHRMVARFEKDLALERTEEGDRLRYKAMKGQLEMIVHLNPENAILHTVLVEKNGFIHGLTAGTPWENRAGVFFEPRAYESWIQPD